MQATTCFHDGIANPILQQPYLVFHNSVAFHPTNGVFNTDSNRRNTTIVGLLRWGELPSRGFFLGLDDRDVRQAESLKALILIQVAARWEGITGQLCQTFIRRFAFTGMTQEAHVTGLGDHKEVFERVTLLLATVIFLLLFGIGRAVDRTFRTIMPKRGVVELPSVICILTIAANSAAVRAGSNCWSAKA